MNITHHSRSYSRFTVATGKAVFFTVAHGPLPRVLPPLLQTSAWHCFWTSCSFRTLLICLGALFTAGSLVNGYRQLWCTVLVLARFNADYRVFRVIWFVRQPHYKAISKRFS